jgi:pimeloyl-ACP methyl ester carboxylesterase
MTTVRGVDLAVTDRGNGDPALLWGHGFGSCVAFEDVFLFDWSRLAAEHRVVRWDARGHGRSTGSPDPADYHWRMLGRDLVALADALSLERFVAGGVSMGAATALHTAVDAPERVAGLVLVLPPTGWETRPLQGDEYTATADVAEQHGVEAAVERMNSEPVPEILTPIAELYRVTPAIADELLPVALRGAGGSDLPPPERVAAITVPALILAWDTDPGHPLSTAERLVELLPDAELHVAHELADVGPWTGHVETFLDRVT